MEIFAISIRKKSKTQTICFHFPKREQKQDKIYRKEKTQNNSLLGDSSMFTAGSCCDARAHDLVCFFKKLFCNVRTMSLLLSKFAEKKN